MALIRPYGGRTPNLHPSVFATEGVVVIGDVEIGEDSSLWFGALVRGDLNLIRIGARTNIQDYTVVHVSGHPPQPTFIGSEVTVGHHAILHGCTVRDRCIIGMGAKVLDRAVIGEESIVGAGSIVAPGTVVPPHTLFMGSPARLKRALTPEEIANFPVLAGRYVANARQYVAEGWPCR